MTSSQIKKIVLDSLKEVADFTKSREVVFYESRPTSTERTLPEASLKISKGLNAPFDKVHNLVMSAMKVYCNYYEEKACTSYVCIDTKIHNIVCYIYKLYEKSNS